MKLTLDNLDEWFDEKEKFVQLIRKAFPPITPKNCPPPPPLNEERYRAMLEKGMKGKQERKYNPQ